MTDSSFETFFLASAGAGGAFIGLLFVALSIAPKTTFGHMADSDTPRQVLAEGALVTMANGFVVSCIALIPGVNVGWVAFVGGIWGAVAAGDIAWRLYRFHRHGTFFETWRHQLRVVTLSLIATCDVSIGCCDQGEGCSSDPNRGRLRCSTSPANPEASDEQP